jgi:hypothetical protein
VFVGVDVKNADPCGTRLAGAVRDEATGQVRVDNRTVTLRAKDGGIAGSVPSNITTFSNIPVCPNQWASKDVFDQTFLLEVSVVDRQGKGASSQVHVRPYCAEPKNEAECRCICKQGYVLGERCDAGVVDGGPQDAHVTDGTPPEGGHG